MHHVTIISFILDYYEVKNIPLSTDRKCGNGLARVSPFLFKNNTVENSSVRGFYYKRKNTYIYLINTQFRV